ncbi:MAG: hypothetical protein M3O68_09960 [Thermoproteota archaeon]|nr:hypothetical protein [Thermoproteota archaeon]
MTEKKVVSSSCHYDDSTNEIKCEVTLNDGTRHSLAAAVISDASANSKKMMRSKKIETTDNEN